MDSAELLERLKLARKRVVDGQICLARQQEVIARLRHAGYPTRQALRVLHEMERTQDIRLSSVELHYSELEYREQVAAAQSMLEGQIIWLPQSHR